LRVLRNCLKTDFIKKMKERINILLLLIYYYYNYYYYFLKLNCHSVAVILTLEQTKQIGINVHKRNNTKTEYKEHKTE